jgi:hypothetical protein
MGVITQNSKYMKLLGHKAISNQICFVPFGIPYFATIATEGVVIKFLSCAKIGL